MYEAVEFVEIERGADPTERVLGRALTVDEAVIVARAAWHEFDTSGQDLYAWWLVREPGVTLALWIADNHSRKEFVLDIRTGELIEVRV
jgi:hypothetical protein